MRTFHHYIAFLFIDGVYKESRHSTREDAAAWLKDIMNRASAAGLPITRPHVTYEQFTQFEGGAIVMAREHYPQIGCASNDPAILDWHPEWR